MRKMTVSRMRERYAQTVLTFRITYAITLLSTVQNIIKYTQKCNIKYNAQYSVTCTLKYNFIHNIKYTAKYNITFIVKYTVKYTIK